MTVSTATPINASVANGATLEFAYQFRILDEGDLYVGVNGLARTLGTHYTVTGVGDAGGGNVVFLPAHMPAHGDRVVRMRVMSYKRDTDFQERGEYAASQVNNDYDAAVMMIQQLAANALQLVTDPDGDDDFVWDAQGYRLINLGDGINPTDAINLAQMEDYVAGVIANGESVSPVKWEFVGDGVTTDFPIPGADVDEALFYDTALAGAVQEPYDDFTIIVDPDPELSVLRFATAPGNLVEGHTILRGFSSPYAGDPITTLRIPLHELAATTLTVDGTYDAGLILADHTDPITLTIRDNLGDEDDFGDGSYFSVEQVGDGQVEIVAELVGTVTVPEGFLAKTRGPGCIITATCTDADTDAWVLSGDLLRETAIPELQTLTIPVSDLTTNLAAGTTKATFVMPYGFLLEADGVRASLRVAQPSGAVLTLDVNRNAASILATKLTFDNAERTTRTAATPFVFEADGDVLAEGDLIDIDIDQVGDVGAQGLVVYLVGQRAS